MKNSGLTLVGIAVSLVTAAAIVWFFPGSKFSGILIGAAGFITAFGCAVFVHELGHFLAAKSFGVHVERFVIGMDKTMMGFLPNCIWERKWGETTYGISLVPLGGYVKMSGLVHPDLQRYIEGTDLQPVDANASEGKLVKEALGDQAALYKRPFYQKFVIYSAGIFMNLLTALALIVYVNVKGEMVDAAFKLKTVYLPEASPLYAAGVRVGDQLVAIDGEKVADSHQMFETVNKRYEATKTESTTTLALSLTRPDVPAPVQIAYAVSPDLHQIVELDSLALRPAYVDYVQFNQPADKAGVEVGDTFLEVGGVPIQDWREMTTIVRASANKPLAVKVRHKSGEVVSLTVKPWESTEEKGVGQIGIGAGNPDKIFSNVALGEAVKLAPGMLVGNVKAQFTRLGVIFGRLLHLNARTAQRELGGPIAVAQAAARHANLGLAAWIKFFIGLNIALAVMNALPFPILDGGHVSFAAFEAVFRRPVPPRVLVPILEGAVIFVIGMALIVTLNDLFKILS